MARSKASKLVERVTGEQVGADIPEGFTPRHYGPALSQVGDSIKGVYEGEGKRRKIGKGKPARMFKIRTAGGVQEIVGAVQIVQFLEDVGEGKMVWIRLRGQVKGGKGRVNLYDFAVVEK